MLRIQRLTVRVADARAAASARAAAGALGAALGRGLAGPAGDRSGNQNASRPSRPREIEIGQLSLALPRGPVDPGRTGSAAAGQLLAALRRALPED